MSLPRLPLHLPLTGLLLFSLVSALPSSADAGRAGIRSKNAKDPQTATTRGKKSKYGSWANQHGSGNYYNISGVEHRAALFKTGNKIHLIKGKGKTSREHTWIANGVRITARTKTGKLGLKTSTREIRLKNGLIRHTKSTDAKGTIPHYEIPPGGHIAPYLTLLGTMATKRDGLVRTSVGGVTVTIFPGHEKITSPGFGPALHNLVDHVRTTGESAGGDLGNHRVFLTP